MSEKYTSEKQHRSRVHPQTFIATGTQTTHANKPVLGSEDSPRQQAEATLIRPREVIGRPMEVVPRPTLPPRGQTFDDTENTLTNSQPYARGYPAEFSPKYVRFGSKARTYRPRNFEAAEVRLLISYRGSIRVPAVGCVVYGSPSVIS